MPCACSSTMATIPACTPGQFCTNWARIGKPIGRVIRSAAPQLNFLENLRRQRPSLSEALRLSRLQCAPWERKGAMADSDRTVDFGFEKVAPADKAERVRAVFASVAAKYDVMNDLMSFGAHRLWKHFTLSLTGFRPGHSALDVSRGTSALPS